MSKYFVRAALVACLSTLIAVSVAAQDDTHFKTNGVKSQAANPDNNIKSDSDVNSDDQRIPAPEAKGGPKAKGLGCEVVVDNRTPYKIQVFMNGDFSGMVSQWGGGSMYLTSGVAFLYGRAVFDDGSVLTFGPRQFRCGTGVFTWTLET